MSTSERALIATFAVLTLVVWRKVAAGVRSQVAGPSDVARPLTIRFTLQADDNDKRVWKLDDMLGLAQQYAEAGLFGGLGAPSVAVADSGTGYDVTISYVGGQHDVTPDDVLGAIGRLDPTVAGRIVDVEVAR